MDKIYLYQIKENIENLSGEKCKLITGNVYDDGELSSKCFVLFKENDDVKNVNVYCTDTDIEYVYTNNNGKVNCMEIVFLWETDCEHDERGYYLNKSDALGGVLCLYGVDFSVEDIVNYK